MRIVGGMALPRAVSISSENFRSAAFVKAGGEIETTVRETPKAQRWLREIRFMPQVARLFGSVFLDFKPRDRIVIVSFIVLVPVLSSVFFSPEEVESFTRSWYEDALNWTVRVVAVAIVLYTILTVRGFHAAEHMAIAAYECYGIEGIDRIAEQDRVHDKCGGRMAIPMFTAFTIGWIVATVSNAWWGPLVPLVLLEVVLWIDVLVGYERIALTQAVSVWLQRNITTKPPNELEISTGRSALRQLLIAEGELPENPKPI